MCKVEDRKQVEPKVVTPLLYCNNYHSGLEYPSTSAHKKPGPTHY